MPESLYEYVKLGVNGKCWENRDERDTEGLEAGSAGADW
jgi:hypothetical protein